MTVYLLVHRITKKFIRKKTLKKYEVYHKTFYKNYNLYNTSKACSPSGYSRDITMAYPKHHPTA